MGFHAEVYKVVMVREGRDAEVLETVFYRKALEVLAEDLMEEGFLPTNPGSYLYGMAVTVTASKKLEHNSVGRKSWIAAVDVPKEFQSGLKELDRNGKGLGKVVEELAGDSNRIIKA